MSSAIHIAIICVCCVYLCNCVWLFVTSWTVAHQAPLSIELSRQEYWSRLPFSTPGNLSNPGSNLCLLHCQADSLPLCHLKKCYWSWSRINIHLCWKLDRSSQYLAISKRLDEGFPGGISDKEPSCQCKRHKRRGFNPWVRKTPWRRAWEPTPIFLPGKFHGQRSLACYSP